jgi:hypothetical protein
MHVFLLSLALAEAPSAEPEFADPWSDRTFVIVASEKTFPAAIAKAGVIAEASGVRFDLRGVGYDPAQSAQNGGLTLSARECEEYGWEYPCYVPRGRWDSGEFLSVEYSSAIQGFTPGFYVVIAGSGDRTEMNAVLAKVKKAVPDAYMKTAGVYLGCMH